MDKMIKREIDDNMRMLGFNPNPEAPRDPRASESTSTSKAYKPSHGGYKNAPRARLTRNVDDGELESFP